MFYSQRDPRWKTVKLGTCGDTLGQSGCFITSLANLAGKVPNEVNELLKKNGGYVNGCLVNSQRATELLGLEYKGKTTQKPEHVCIAETNYYAKSGVPQHFFLWNPDGRIADPLDMNPNWQQNIKKYSIVSYRLFCTKERKPEPVPTPVADPVVTDPIPADSGVTTSVSKEEVVVATPIASSEPKSDVPAHTETKKQETLPVERSLPQVIGDFLAMVFGLIGNLFKGK